MKLFAVNNLTSIELAECQPWKYKADAEIPDEIRKTKHARQEWYQDKATRHNFYTGIEPANPNVRLSKENPARLLHCFVADYDIPATDEVINRAIERMELRPTWVEKSLGGNFRLVWMLKNPIPLDYPGFAEHILVSAVTWLPTGELPGLDEKAFTDPARLYCNGCMWRPTAQGTLAEHRIQSFLFQASEKFRFVDGCNTTTNIPLEVVVEELKKQHPSFNWPTEFTLGSQGPTFWVPESTSTKSAIVRNGGMQTFSAHAGKPFFSWTDLLGKEFTKEFSAKAIDKATSGVYWDGRRFWKKNLEGQYKSCSKDELINHFRVNCGLSDKRENGVSIIDRALQFIYDNNSVVGGAPFVCQPPGFLHLNDGRKVVNTYMGKPMQPVAGPVKWEDMELVNLWCDSVFDGDNKVNFLAWWKLSYEAAHYNRPHPGQNIFLMGGAGKGKTLCSSKMVGPTCGGSRDASDFLIRGASFNSELFEVPIWCVDDDQAGNNEQQKRFEAMVKKMAANQEHQCHQKFEVPVKVDWAGRAIITSNLDFVSSRILGPMDNTSSDKISIFKLRDDAQFEFSSRKDTEDKIARDLPKMCRFLLDWEIPASVKRDPRFGVAAFHDKSMLEQSAQTGRASLFKEVLVEALANYFLARPGELEWRGTVAQLFRFLSDTSASGGVSDPVVRTLKIESVNRNLEQLQREKCLDIEAVAGPKNTRVWVIKKFEGAPRLEPNE